MKNKNRKNDQSWLSSIISTAKEAKEHIAELGEVGLDFITENDVVAQIPVVSLAVRTLNIKDSYQKFRLKRNAIAFYESVCSLDNDDVDRLHEEIKSNSKFSEEFIDTTISILLESEKPIKSSIYGNIVNALAEKKITPAEFEDLSLLVQSASIPALLSIPKFFKRSKNKTYLDLKLIPEEPLLLSIGVCYRYGNIFRISALGIMLHAYGFNFAQESEGET